MDTGRLFVSFCNICLDNLPACGEALPSAQISCALPATSPRWPSRPRSRPRPAHLHARPQAASPPVSYPSMPDFTNA